MKTRMIVSGPVESLMSTTAPKGAMSPSALRNVTQAAPRVQFPPLPRLCIKVPVFVYHFRAVNSVPPRSLRYIRRIAILATACSRAIDTGRTELP
jgi:hypothetical protein